MSETSAPVNEQEYRMLEAFVYREAQLADESRFDEWEALLADDMQYWIPIVNGEPAGEFDASIVNDNRSRLATRLRQLRTGTRHSQAPLSIMRRLISNVVATKLTENTYQVEANFVVHEYQKQSVNQLNMWPGRVVYRLRAEAGELKMSLKKVMLINSGGPLPSLSFLI
jgi:benzoate/toluate 1,2-dioxygenase beta subunit